MRERARARELRTYDVIADGWHACVVYVGTNMRERIQQNTHHMCVLYTQQPFSYKPLAIFMGSATRARTHTHMKSASITYDAGSRSHWPLDIDTYTTHHRRRRCFVAARRWRVCCSLLTDGSASSHVCVCWRVTTKSIRLKCWGGTWEWSPHAHFLHWKSMILRPSPLPDTYQLICVQ